MLYWTNENDRVEGPNKEREIKKHLDGIPPPPFEGAEVTNPYATVYQKKQTSFKHVPYRAATSPMGSGGLGPEVAVFMKDN